MKNVEKWQKRKKRTVIMQNFRIFRRQLSYFAIIRVVFFAGDYYSSLFTQVRLFVQVVL